MTNRAAFAQRFVFVNHELRLLAMALRTAVVESSKGKAALRFKNIHAVRIVALDTIHFSFEHRMMLRQSEFRVLLDVARETRGWLFPGIHDEFSPSTTRLHMQTSRSMARFATDSARRQVTADVKSRMRTRSKHPRVVGVAFSTRLIADECGAFDHGRRKHCSVGQGRGTGAGKETDRDKTGE